MRGASRSPRAAAGGRRRPTRRYSSSTSRGEDRISCFTLRPRRVPRHSSPASSRASSDIIDWFHGGSNTSSTSARSTVGMHLDLLPHVLRQDLAHAAAGRRQRHLDLDDRARRSRRALDLALVDEAELDDVDRDLRVVAGAQLLPDQLLRYPPSVASSAARAPCSGSLPIASRVLAGDAEQVALDVDGEAAAERLRDEARPARAQRDRDRRRES